MEFKRSGLFLMGVLGSLALSPVNAATYNVTKIADTNDGTCDADCSLREAVGAANALAGADVINLPAGEYQITIVGSGEDNNTTGDFDVLDDLTIIGAGNAITTVNGMGLYNIFDVNTSGVSLSIRDTTLRNAWGAAIDFYGSGTLDVAGSVFTKNQYIGYGASIEIRGGSILTVDNSLFTDNCSVSAPAIDGEGTWTITNSTFSNHGGWFVPDQGAEYQCNINASGGGGTMYLQSTYATIINSSFINNEADGGGAIHGWYGTLDIINSTFSNNRALSSWYGGGAIELYNVVGTIKNSTIANNHAPNSAGGGVMVHPNSTLAVENSIIANNSSPTSQDCDGNVTSLGYTLIGDLTGCVYTGGTGNLTGMAGLDSFSDDGSPGNGHYPLLPSSQAVDAGNNATCAADDQLGTVRPFDGDSDGTATCDIGAIELKPSLLAVTDTVVISEDDYVLGNVTTNDFLGTAPTTITAITSPGSGEAYIIQPGSILYIPNPDFNGIDSLTYTITDASSNSSTATVMIVVTAVNDLPVAANDTSETPVDTAITTMVLDNDYLGDTPTTVTAILTPPTNGTAIPSGDRIFYFPNTGFTGTDSYLYQITDSNGDSSIAMVNITVWGDLLPVAVNDIAMSAIDDFVIIPVLSNDTQGNPVTEVTSVTAAENGYSVRYDESNILYAPFTGFTGVDIFSYTITDGDGDSSSATVFVIVD